MNLKVTKDKRTIVVTRSADIASQLVRAKCNYPALLTALMMTDSIECFRADELTKAQWRAVFFKLDAGTLSREVRKLCL